MLFALIGGASVGTCATVAARDLLAKEGVSSAPVAEHLRIRGYRIVERELLLGHLVAALARDLRCLRFRDDTRHNHAVVEALLGASCARCDLVRAKQLLPSPGSLVALFHFVVHDQVGGL